MIWFVMITLFSQRKQTKEETAFQHIVLNCKKNDIRHMDIVLVTTDDYNRTGNVYVHNTTVSQL